MHRIIAILGLFLIVQPQSNAQEKYKGLLWEISGNGLEEKSYLYGTMHVSGRIAYHLGEEFFKGLNEVDAVALESNPIIWLDEIVESKYADSYLGWYAIKYQKYKGFYKDAFKVKVPEKKELAQALSTDHYLSNWMLYRESRGKADFEEETFLDMFIYQAGSKNDKIVYSLEDFKQTSVFSQLSRIPDVEKKETSAWYKEMTEDKRYYELLQDSYRDQDLDLMDSLQKEVSSDNHMKYMLYDRNVIMAKNIDSIISSGTSLFIGIGAAHLPKKKGVIGLLRDKGYTVTSVSPTFSESAKKMKEDFSEKKKSVAYNKSFSTELFSLTLPCRMYETPAASYQRSFFAPELTNGTFYTVKQLSTYAYLKGEEEIDFLSRMDSLLFENIPGKILEKNIIKKNGFKGLDIVNQTKSGDIQHYQLFITPINILIFKAGGKDDFVKTDGDSFFDGIKLTPLASSWKTVSPIKKDYSVKVPAYAHFKSNTKAASLYGHVELEAYDNKEDVYYLLKRSALKDVEFIEEDEYELKRLIDKTCEELDIDTVYDIDILDNKETPSAIGYTKTKSGRFLQMKVVINGPFYYMLMTVSKEKLKSNMFFSSFKLNNFTYLFDFEDKIDSTLNFEVNSNYLSPTPFQQMVDKAYERRRNKNDKEDKAYLRKRKSETYYSENFESVDVEYVKFHRYRQYDNIDSLWNREVRYFSKENNLDVASKETSKKNGLDILDVVYTDTGSVRSIYKRYILNKGVMYALTSNLSLTGEKSKFITNFYETFTPKNEDNNISVLDDKPNMFFQAINGTDSLEKERALKSVEDYVVFDDENAPQMIETIKKYPFGARHIGAKAQLIKDLGKLDNDETISFLTQLYDQMEDTAMFQLAILKALASKKDKEAAKNFLKLLEKDIPLSGSKWGGANIFNAYYDSLTLTNVLYPKLLDYTFVSDYKGDIYDLLGTAVDSNAVKKKRYKKRYKQILREAKIALKSQISYEQTQQAKEGEASYYYTSYKNSGNKRLVKFATMLISFYKKKDVQVFFSKMDRVQDYQVKTDIACIKTLNKIAVSKSEWDVLAEDVINNSYLYDKLDKIKRLDLFPTKHKDQELMAKSLLYGNNFNFKKDSLLFIEKQLVKAQHEEGYVYFFKSKGEKDDKWKIDYVGLQPKDESKVSTEATFSKKGVKIQKGKEISEILEEQIKQIKVEGHKRADESVTGNYDYFNY